MPTTACASVQMAGRPQIGGTLQGGTLKKAAAVGCRQPCRRQVGLLLRASAASMPSPDSSNGASQPHTNGNGGEVPAPTTFLPAASSTSSSGGGLLGWFREQQLRSAELRKRLASLGLAAVLAYGLFDAVSYTIAYVLAWLAYEARTGLNPTQNLGDIVKICILMWAGNNVTRPFRLAGAAALAPVMDRLMERLRDRLGLKNKGTAFGIIVAVVAAIAFGVVGGLFFSRWVQG